MGITIAPGFTLTPIRELARGGMGRVDLAIGREEGFTRLYAVKHLHSHLADDPAFVRGFMEEARIAGLIRHPNVVSVLSVGRREGVPFLVMEYVEGLTCAALVRHHQATTPLPLQLWARIALGTCLGLAAAHELTDVDGKRLDLVHRDISPQNLLLGFDGAVRLTDFGIARAHGRLTDHTATGILKGKMGYMAPEQLRFEDATQKSDLFSLGVTLHELLTHRRVFRRENDAATARALLEGDIPDLADFRDDCPPEVEELLLQMLAHAPASRPESAREVADRIAALLDRLVATEGTMSLQRYMEAVHADSLTEARERTRQLIAEAPPLEPEPGSAPDTEPEPETMDLRSPAARRRRRPRDAAAVGALIVAALVAAAAAAAWGWPAGDADAGATPAPSAVDEAAQDPRPAVTSTAPEPASLPAQPVDDPVADPSPEDPPPPQRRPRRRRARPAEGAAQQGADEPVMAREVWRLP